MNSMFWMIPLYLVFFVITSFSTLCQLYAVIVSVFTIFSGIRLVFQGQYFQVFPAFPFMIFNLQLSILCFGWGFSTLGYFIIKIIIERFKKLNRNKISY